MRYRFYTKSADAWLAMLEAVQGAKDSIFLESYILADDEITHNFFETIKERARSGIKVKIIVDRIGNFWTTSINRQEMERAGVEVLFFNRWLYRNHRKILIVDKRLAFVGGVNIKGEYADWLDLHLRLRGHITRYILNSFVRIYRLAGGMDRELLSIKKFKFGKVRLALYKTKTKFIEHWPIKGKSALRDYYRQSCDKAKKNITIVTPYFIPHRWLINALYRALDRGVNVEIILPAKTDTRLGDTIHLIFAHLLDNRLKFLFLPEMNHAKVLVIDNSSGLVGSNNIDALSFDFNLEASVVFQHKNMILDLKKIIETWKKTAVSLKESEKKRKWYYPILFFLIKLVQPIL